MNKKTIVANIIFVVLLIACISIYTILTFKNSELSNENKELKESINNQNVIIKEYEELISGYEIQNKDLQTEIDTLNEEVNGVRYELTKSRAREAKFLERTEEDLISSIDYYDKYSNLVASIHDEFEMFVHKNKIIRIDMDEDDFKDLFGEPMNEKVSIDTGDPIGHMEGLYWKISKYSDFIIYYLGDKKGENYKIQSFITESNNVTTIRGIKVGDSLDLLFERYQMLDKIEYPDGSIYYYFPEDDYVTSLEFEVKNNLIIRIRYIGYL